MSTTIHRDDHVADALASISARGVTVRPWSEPEPGGPLPGAAGTPDGPTLYLIPDDAPAPTSWHPLEDWVRLPLDVDEAHHRAERLLARHGSDVRVEVDSDGVLHVGEALAVLSPLEARLMRVLLAEEGRFVPRERLTEAVWPDEPPRHRWALDNRVRTLRLRIEGLPLQIHSVRDRGLLLVRTDRPMRLDGAPQVVAEAAS